MSVRGTVQFTYVVPETLGTRRRQALRKKIETNILQTAANEGMEISEDDVMRKIHMEEVKKKYYVVSKPMLNIILRYVWDKGLCGPSNKRKIDQLYCNCQLGPSAVGERDKLTTKVANVYRTYRETKEIFKDPWQGLDQLASRISTLLNCFKQREGALNALGVYGIRLCEEECVN